MTDDHELRPEETRGPVAWMARNPVAANVAMLLLSIGGVLLLIFSVKQEVFPEVDLDLIVVNVAYPGASPEEVEQGVVLAIEEAVRGLDGVSEVRAAVYEGLAVVSIELLLGTSHDRALADVKSAIDRVASFPESIERPIVSLVSNRQQVISLVLYGDVEESALRDLANGVRDEILDDPRITYADVYGIRPLEVSIEVPRRTLREHGLTLGDVARSVSSASVELPGGEIRTRAGDVLLRTAERRDRGEDFGEIVLLSRPDGTQVRLRDVATIDDGFQETVREALFNGQRAAMINVYRVGDERPLDVADAVKEHAARLERTLPDSVHVTTWADISEMYAQRIELLLDDGRIGLLLVILILALFLEPRLAFWVTLGIPVSVAASLVVLPAADVSINMVSLFAFIVTLGIVCDDAIVIGDAVYKLRSEGKPLLVAAVRGTREVAVPVTFSVLTTCVAFAPLLFVPGVMGKFFQMIPIVVISVLLISLLESLFVLPAHLAHPMPWWLRIVLYPYMKLMELVRADRFASGLERFVNRFYVPFLASAMRWRYLTVATAIAVFVATIGLVAGGRVAFEFFPNVEGDLIIAQLRMPVGTPASVTESITHHMVDTAEHLADQGEGRSISRGVYADLGAAVSFGGGPEGPIATSGAAFSTVMVYLVQSDQRDLSTTEFTDRWRRAIGDVPGAESLTFEHEIGPHAGAAIDFQLSHPDKRVLEASAEVLASRMRHYGPLRDIESGVHAGKEQLDFHLTPVGRALGLTEADLARQLRDAFFGAPAVRQQRGRDEVRAYVRLPDDERGSLDDLERFVVRTPRGGEIPLLQAADVERGHAYTVIRRTDGRRTLGVSAEVGPDGNANDLTQKITRDELTPLLADTPGLTYRVGGEQKEQSATLGALRVGFLAALLAMYAMIAIVFRSYAQPLVIMSAIPFGIVGAVWGHAMLGLSLSIMSVMGIVALSGVVVNDTLVFVAAINDHRKEGLSVDSAITEAGARRFRAIFLTSTTTFLGLFPLILEPSVQARFLVPMAVSLGFGCLFATGITMILVPVAYRVLEDFIGIFERAVAPFAEAAPIRPPDELSSEE